MLDSFLLRWRAALAASAVSLAVAACGGGGGGGSSAGVGSGGTGSYASGSITGFGSIIVNGVHYDDSDAEVLDDDGATRSSNDLRLGMVVEIEGSAITTDATTGQRRASASRIRYGSEIEGPVAAVDAGAGTLEVLGQTAVVTRSTVFDDDVRNGLAGLRVGDVVEINGYYTTDGRYTVTRLDVEDDADDGYKLRGPIASLDSAARTLRIGTAVIDYSSAGTVPAGLAVGSFVKAELSTRRNGAEQWVATRLTVGSAASGAVGGGSDGAEAELEGFITSFTSATAFSVNGVPVDASGVGRLPAGLAAGVRVEVEGRLSGGRLVAREVEVEGDDDDGDDDGFELEGRITSLDAAAQVFVVRGVRVSYAGDVRYEDGDERSLRVGAEVEVKGELAADGQTVDAVEIEFDD